MATHVGLLPSQSRTTSVTSPVISVAEKYEAAHIVLNVTAGTGFGLTLTVKGKDLTSGSTYDILASSFVTSTGTTVLKVGPAYTAGANVAKDYMPGDWLVAVTASGTAATYSLGASLI